MPRAAGLFAALALLAPVGLMADPASDAARRTGSPAKPAEAGPRIEIALLLDTSNSMDGLINQARAQLWKVVSDLATAEKDGKIPHLRVALYEYGNQGLPSDGGFVRQVLPFTDDLDKVSEELFALSTNGGDEYCGRVIEAAAQGLDWSAADDLKIIVIAGNEPFTQGPVDYKKACGEAVAKGIVVNTIFCGDKQEGISTNWADGAKLADGSYSHIDQDQQVAEIATPFDAELTRLNGDLNGTYLFFGAADRRRAFAGNQVAQDANAAGLGGGVLVERAAAKSSTAYSNADRDLVDALKKDEKALETLKEEELPDELKGKSAEEREKIVRAKAADREKVQKQINELAEKRKAFIADERTKQAAAGEAGPTLDAALVKSLREQAAKKDYTFKK